MRSKATTRNERTGIHWPPTLQVHVAEETDVQYPEPMSCPLHPRPFSWLFWDCRTGFKVARRNDVRMYTYRTYRRLGTMQEWGTKKSTKAAEYLTATTWQFDAGFFVDFVQVFPRSWIELFAQNLPDDRLVKAVVPVIENEVRYCPWLNSFLRIIASRSNDPKGLPLNQMLFGALR